MNDDNFLETLAASLTQHASVKNVFGEPVWAGEKMIIPVAQVMLGMGGGHGHSNQPHKQLLLPDPSQTSSRNKSELPIDGVGAGGGMRVVAKGVYEITSKRTRFIPVYDVKEILFGLAAGFLLGRLTLPRLPKKQR